MMVSKRRLSAEFAQNISNWRHSGFQVHCGPPVEADQPQALERLAAYILRPSFASTRVRYLAGSGQVQYRTAKGVARSMDALDWIAQVVSHIPDPGEQWLRYDGWYSNASRGKRRKPGVRVPVEAELQDTPQPDSDGEHFAQRRRSSRPAPQKDLRSRSTSLSPLWQRNADHRLDRAIGGDPQDPPASGPVGAATTFSPAQAVSSQAGNLYGFSLSPAGPRNSSLHGFGFLGRCPGLERLKSQGSSAVIQYPCAFFSLFSHSFLPHFLSHNLRAGSACYAHDPASKKTVFTCFSNRNPLASESKLLYVGYVPGEDSSPSPGTLLTKERGGLSLRGLSPFFLQLCPKCARGKLTPTHSSQLKPI